MTIEMNIGAEGTQCIVTLQRTSEFEALKKVAAYASKGIPFNLTEGEQLAIDQLSRTMQKIQIT